MAEYRMLQSENLPGIYVIPSYESSFLWFGVVCVRSGSYYEGGVFRFTLTLPEKFPNEEVPVITFDPPIYHPAVDSNTGALYLNEVFPQWLDQKLHLWHLLKYVQHIFYNCSVKAPVNMEASVAYKTNKKLFVEKAKECVAASIDHIYDDPPVNDKHYISFKPYEPEHHDLFKDMLKLQTGTDGATQGISWVQPDSFQPFSKEEV